MAKQIKDFMSSRVDTLSPDQTVAEAAKMMRDDDVGAIPVAENDRLIGMVTDRDIVVRSLANGRDASQMPVREVMSDKLLYCFEDQDIAEVAQNMGDQQVRRLPVMNRDKQLVGIVSLGDIAARGAQQTAGEALEQIAQ